MASKKLPRPSTTFRGVVGDFAGPSSALFAHYRFEFKVPTFKWRIDQDRGDFLVEWGDRAMESIRESLRRDADKLDVPLGFLMDNANFEIAGIGARDFDERGEPLWREGESMRLWSRMRPTFDMAHEEMRDKLQSIGDNSIGLRMVSRGIHPRPKDTKPIFLRPDLLIVRVNSTGFGDLGAMAQDFFMRQDEKRRSRIITRRLDTMLRNRRSRAAKRAWRTRRRQARVETAMRGLSRRDNEKIAKLLLKYLEGLMRESEREGKQRGKTRGGRSSRSGHGSARNRRGVAKPRPVDAPKKHKSRRNPRP